MLKGKTKVKVSATAIMTVCENCSNRIDGDPDPNNASIWGGTTLFTDLLGGLQVKGVRPGDKIKITIEKV